MKGIRLRFIFWIIGWFVLFGLANIKLLAFPHILLLFWTLMPILSLVYSAISRKKMVLSLRLEPSAIPRGGKGEWVYTLDNQSHLMSFFLRFPDISVKKEGKMKAFEVMVQPGEKREVRLSYTLPHTGPYSLIDRQPLFEDLLGFFWLDFSSNLQGKTLPAYAFPLFSEEPLSDQQEMVISDYEQAAQQKTLNTVTDDIFSIEPIRQGESLAHAHWKLSARMQQWMIKHYSDFEQEPLRLLLDFREINAEPRLHFLEGEEEKIPADQMRLLEERDAFADCFYHFALRFLEGGSTIELGDRSSRCIQIPGLSAKEELAQWIASRPFALYDHRWKLEDRGQNRQILFVEDLNQENTGSLLRYSDLGIPFLLVSIKSGLSRETLATLESSSFEILWLDESATDF